MTSSPSEITALLNAADDGSQEALCGLWNAVQQKVRAMAGLLIAREPNSADLQPTLVMNEVFLRMNARDELAPLWESRQHFFGCVWRVMRQFALDQTVDQVAAAMELSPRTAAEDWRYARTWLRRELACDRRHA